ncbi:alpha-ketoglutarate-dependent dioxygenase AlkB [Rhizobium grahamii]|uniref:Alpha-ketoglutarate-dependent dioxygenase AlkB n=1 Tax=Rhizobium grahamii TaxID=1120045 RepID=A0A5Q0C229_9HYPH|nr:MULTISPECIES: alpha-ketoglutarate-dependent dioxygenase AlkB [Rhizobium]QFY59493.1 alpha-ketoglutarate-dependent dioxygenase AlkB [Rhizobium grahamii]QRM47981.1 alpha-ketoglutarate-dependent dioxygenase AlkB [Rhizobium sp. BG6]
MDAGFPEGLTYVPEFLSEAASKALADALDADEWDQTLKRRVQHFGYRYDYRARSVETDAYLGPLPDWLATVAQRLVCEGHFHHAPDQVIANEYWPGQGISAHVDCVPCFGGSIVSLSLLSPCEMIFRNPETGDRRFVMLQPGALLKMEGPARYQWTHEIPARLADTVHGERRLRGRRLSLTFRNVTLGENPT